MRASAGLRGVSVREMALELRTIHRVSISPQVLANIAAGNQKTCRRSIRDGITRYVGWPVTSDWLSGAPQPEATADFSPSAYLETLQTAQRIVQATLTYERRKHGDLRHLRDFVNESTGEEEVEVAEEEFIIKRAVPLAMRTVAPVLNWAAWVRVLSDISYEPPTLGVLNADATSDAERWSPGMYESILEDAFAHWAGSAIRIALDNGGVPLDPVLLERVAAWVQQNLNTTFLEHLSRKHTGPTPDVDASATPTTTSDATNTGDESQEILPGLVIGESIEQGRADSLAWFRGFVQQGAERFSPGQDKSEAMSRVLAEWSRHLDRLQTPSELRAFLRNFVRSIGNKAPDFDRMINNIVDIAARHRK